MNKIATGQNRPGGCEVCPLGCVSSGVLTASRESIDASDLVVAPPAGALNKVTGVLFGLPLVTLVVLVLVLEVGGMADQPLISLGVLAGAAALWLRILVPFGDRLLGVLQSQPLPADAEDNRNTV